MFSSTIYIPVIQWILLFSLAVVSAAAVSVLVPRAGTTRPDHKLFPSADLGYDCSLEDQNPTTSSKGTGDKHVERIVQSQWEKHRRWSLIASERKRMLEIGRISKLVLVSTGAVAQVASTQLPVQYKAFAKVFGGLCIGAGTYIKTKVITDEKMKKMVASFKTSQAIKAEVYKFRAQVGPYAYGQLKNKPGEEALNLLRQRCSNFSRNTKDHKYYSTLPDSKPAPGSLDTIDEYIEKRIDRIVQHFYIKQARIMNKRATICSNCETTLLTLAFLTTSIPTNLIPDVVQNVVTSISGWGVAFTTVSVAFANHLAREKFNDIADEYFRAAEELKDIKDTWPSKATMAGAPGWENKGIESENVIRQTIDKWEKVKTGQKDLPLQELTPVKKDLSKMVWNPATICGADECGVYRASDRVEWLVDNTDMTQLDAQKKVMSEFPANF